MSHIVRFPSGQLTEYQADGNALFYEKDPDALVNPDLSLVVNLPVKYWKRSGNTVVPMTATEKQAADTLEQSLKDAAIDQYKVDPTILVKAVVIAGNKKWRLGQAVTKQDIVDELKILLA